MNALSLIKVMIVDDHPLIRVGIATVVNQQADMTLAAEADGGPRVLELYRQHRPDVVLMDLRLRGESGARLTTAIRSEFPEARVLVISNYEGDEDIHQALEAGAKGYLFKSVVEDELIDAIREVNAGRTYLPRGVAARLQENGGGVRLTRREHELLELLGKGLGNRELGQVLGVAEDTVKSHLKSLFRKLGVADRAEAVREGLRRGFVRPE
ncbi:MAG: response regulator transcription factor [Verrucomicrobia bacterium]|nr:response regulator transcription factor [Verrucomicrobiota bacterium]